MGTLGKRWKLKHKRKGRKKTPEEIEKLRKANLGKKLSEEHKRKMSLARIGKYTDEESPMWKGENVGYRGLHIWVQKHKGKAVRCEKCGLSEIPKGMKRYFQWANKSREYKRDLSDWMQLCVKCHKKFDKKL